MHDQNRPHDPQEEENYFRLDLPQETPTEETDFEPPIPGTDGLDEETEQEVLHSYSDPSAARREQEQRQRAAALAERDFRKRNKAKRKRNRRFFRTVWIMMVLILAALLSRFAVSGINDMLAVNRNSYNITVEIPQNASTAQIAGILQKAGAIRDVSFFRLYSKMTKADGRYAGGSFQISTGMDYEAIINHLQSNLNRIDTVKITFPEGTNTLELAALFEKNGVCSAKDVLTVANSAKFDGKYDLIKAISNAGSRYYKLEGYLFPDTYEFYKNEDPEQALQKLLSNCNKKLTADIRAKAKAQKMTVDQLLTFASLVQAEAASKDDMYRVSSVFHNRLTSGGKDDLLRLRSDPTIYYPYRTKAAVPSDIRETYQSRYNTYNVKGLPPGPICNPGADAIDAALNPSKTGYYYFCHDKNGKAYYAKTLAEHEKNLVKAGLK